jgi:hypothetical protein
MSYQNNHPFNEARRKIVFDVLERFPDHASLSLAKKIYSENPGLFNCCEHVRTMIRFYRGTNGNRARAGLKNRTYVRKSIPTT